MRPASLLAIAGVLAVVPLNARADEVFLCNDHSMVHVTTPTRVLKYQDNCVKEWFGANAAQAAKPAAASVQAVVPQPATPAASTGVSPARGSKASEVIIKNSAPTAGSQEMSSPDKAGAPADGPKREPAAVSSPGPQSSLEAPKMTRGGRRG
jgi:hypothetical protein